MSLPGFALVALTLPAAATAALWWAPWLPILLTPALIPFPQAGVLFPFEWSFAVATALAAVHLRRTRSAALATSHPAELANLAFVAWALFTGFWAFDGLHLFLGTRRMLVGLLAGAVALRLHAVVPRRTWELSVLLGGIAIAGTALLRAAASGLSASQAIFHRSSATDLGWGTANYIATLLLLIGPVALALALTRGPLAMRALAWTTVVLGMAVQMLVASRAAAVLYVVGLFVQLFLGWRRRARWMGLATLVALLAISLATPFGQALLMRFTNLRDVGSMLIRLWYLREGWQRTLDHLPWGLGLNQGIPYPDKLAGIDIHNHWLVVSSELGVPGVLLWLAAVVLLFRGLRRLRRVPGHAPLALALMVSFWLGLTHSLVEPTFQGVQYQFLWFWLMFGALGYGLAATASASSER